MQLELKPTLISYKQRTVKINGKWIKAASDFDLNQVRLNEVATYELAQEFDGTYYIVAKKEEANDY